MRSFFLDLSNKHGLLMKLLLFTGTALILAYLFPSSPKFSYKYQAGKIWEYKSLRAPFDFSIVKSKEELEQEKEKAQLNSPLCFRMIEETEKYQENKLNLKLSSDPKLRSEDARQGVKRKNTSETEKHGESQSKANEILKTIYERGVLNSMDEQLAKERNAASPVLIIRKDHTREVLLSSLFDIPGARAYASEHLTGFSESGKDALENILDPLIEGNILYDDTLTKKLLDENLSAVTATKGFVSEGQAIISTGERINADKKAVLDSFKNEFESRYSYGRNWIYFAAHLLLAAIALSMLLLFLFLFRKDIFANNKKIVLLLSLIVLMSALYTWTLHAKLFSMYLVPLCILPIVIRTFFDTRMALYTHLVLVLILGFLAPDGFEFTFIQMTAGMVAIFSIVNLRNRSQFFISAILIFCVFILDYFALSLLKEGSIAEIDWAEMKWFAGNAMLTLFAYPLIYLTEKVFGFVSDVSLLELTDSNNGLLRDLAARAPGTFQHSLQVSNLAEAAIYKIGGNPLMIRAGALYHDIGKMEMPMYFIENQNTSVNPHDEISFEESAEIIISHVIRGVEIAKKNNLPDQLIDFIRTHHGTTMVQYFYRSYLKNFPDEIVDEAKFRYPGPLPYSRETAVLMMADSVEAAARSLKKPDEASIEALIESVIENLVREKQFSNSNITFRDIASIKKIFRKMLTSIHHTRVEYPR